jgi:hypothetical protein
MGELSYERAPALLISFIIFIAVALSYVPLYMFNGAFDFTNMVKYFYVYFSKNTNDDECKIIGYKAIHFCIFLFGFFIAGFAVICIMLGGPSAFNATVMGYLSTYYFTIVLFTFVLLQMNPYFINIFENTFGYLFLKAFNGWSDFFKYFNLFDLNQLGKSIQPTTAEPYVSTDKDFLITVLDILKPPEFITITDEIKKCLYAKHFVGHFVWVYFACLICTFTIIKTMAYNA